MTLLRTELDACRAEIARLRAQLVPWRGVAAGVDYCTTHAGVRNEDESRCDFADDLEVDAPCRLRPLFYLPEATL